MCCSPAKSRKTMPSAFARLDAIAAQTMTSVMGEAYELRPQAKASANAISTPPDPNRPVRPIVGIFRDKPELVKTVNAFDVRADQRPGLSTGSPTIEVDPRVQAEAMAIGDIRKDDLLVEVIAPGQYGPIWRVSHPDVDAMGRILCRVTVLS